MIKRLLLLIAIITSISSQAQTFPYLNASTGNENEFPVDKDTNIYMFHGDRLVKTDKNFNVIWANTYTGLYFTSLLLSKTGSIYFTGYSFYGKLKSNGAIEWVKSLNTMKVVYPAWPPPYSGLQPGAHAIILDRNDNLIISGTHSPSNGVAIYTNSFMLKSDTNGTLIKFKPFLLTHTPSVFKILSDSSGVFKFLSIGEFVPSGSGLSMIRYSDVNDTFLSVKIRTTSPPTTFAHNSCYIIKSKFNSDYYVSFSNLGVSSFPYNAVFKLTENFDQKWGIGIPYSSFTVSKLHSARVEEIRDGVFYPLYSSCTGCPPINNGFVKIDTLGNSNGILNTMLDNYYYYPGPPPAVWYLNKFSMRSVTDNKFYFDATGYYFPANPLVIQKLNASLNNACSNNYSITSTVMNLSNYTVDNTSQIASVSSFTAPSNASVTVSNISFAVDTNFCLIASYKELESASFQISPNPAHSKIVINASDKIEVVEVHDISGKLISTHSYTNEIDVSELMHGMYFLRMNFGNEIVTKKFIKE